MLQDEFRFYALEDSRRPLPSANEGVLVVDLNFRLIACDRGADSILQDLGCHNGEGRRLPAEIRERLGAQAPVDLGSLMFHFTVASQDYSCRTFLVEPLNGNGQPTVLTVHLQRASSLIDAINKVAMEYHLTDRESEALRGIAMGLTTKALAKEMNISPNTVNAFLRLIMIKMGVTTRAGVVGKVLEQNGPGAAVNFPALRRGACHA